MAEIPERVGEAVQEREWVESVLTKMYTTGHGLIQVFITKAPDLAQSFTALVTTLSLDLA